MSDEAPWKFEGAPPPAAITPQLLDAVKHVESRGNPAAVSPAGARGPYQFMPATAAQYGLRDPHDEPSAREAASRYLGDLAKQFGGDVDKALLAYNWGPGNVQRYLKTGGPMPAEAQQYVGKVRTAEKNMSGQTDEAPPWKFEGAAPSAAPAAGRAPSPAPAPAAQPKSSVLRDLNVGILGLPETILSMGTGAIAQAYGGLKGLGTLATGGGLENAVKQITDAEQRYTYQPRLVAGKELTQNLGNTMAGINEGLGTVGGAIGGEAGRAIGESALPLALTVAPVPKLARSFAANPAITFKQPLTHGFMTSEGKILSGEDVAAARDIAPKLNAWETAQKHNIVTDPSLTNPNRFNEFAASQVGPEDIAARLSMENEPKWNRIVASDPDLNIQAPLSLDVLKQVRDRAAEPNRLIAQTGTMYPTENTLSALDGLNVRVGISNASEAAAANNVVARAKAMIADGMPASDVLANISQLRESARKIFNSPASGLADQAKAKTSLQVANALEGMVDSHLQKLAVEDPYAGYGELGDAYRQGRRTMAKSYAVEDAFNENTRQVDPAKIAKMTAEDNALTGHLADIGQVAGVFPEIAELGARTRPLSKVHLSRYSLPGAIGGTLGMLVGAPGGPLAGVAGAGAGGMLGAGAGEFISRALRNKVVTPEAQLRGLNPVPREIWDLSGVDPLGPRPQYGTPNLRRDTVSRVLRQSKKLPPAPTVKALKHKE